MIQFVKKRLHHFRFVQTVLLCVILLNNCFGQIAGGHASVVSASVNAYNVSPRALTDVGIMNAGPSSSATLQCFLYNSSGEVLLEVKTNPFTIKNGLNMTAAALLSLASTNYGVVSQAQYIRNFHTLPSGEYNFCAILSIPSQDFQDEYCTEITSDLSMELMLVSPANRDTIDSPNPDLVWNHNQPFNVLASAEFFRMIVVELNKDQSAEIGVAVNQPIMMKDYLQTHSVIYPASSKTLLPGHRYGWQVQVITNGVITNQTEAWEFTPRMTSIATDNKYAVLKRTADGSFYTIENNKIFFKFNEAYAAGNLNCKIIDSKLKEVKMKLTNASAKPGAGISLKSKGYNRFEIDLDEFDVEPGRYTLLVKNEKGEKYVLNFLIK